MEPKPSDTWQCFRGHPWDGQRRGFTNKPFCKECSRILYERRRDKLRAIRAEYRPDTVRIQCD